MYKKNLKFLILAAMFTALEVVTVRLLPLTYYLPPGTFEVRVSAQFLCYGLAGWLVGPWWGMGSAVAADLIGVFINPTGSGVFFPGYTLSAAIGGLLYGLFLYKKQPSIWRCLGAVASQTVICGLALGALWSSIYYGKGWLGMIITQYPIRLLLIIPYALALLGLQNALPKQLTRR